MEDQLEPECAGHLSKGAQKCNILLFYLIFIKLALIVGILIGSKVPPPCICINSRAKRNRSKPSIQRKQSIHIHMHTIIHSPIHTILSFVDKQVNSDACNWCVMHYTTNFVINVYMYDPSPYIM